MKRILLCVLLTAGLVLIGSSMASLLGEPAKSPQTRLVSAGGATLQVPLHMPKEITRGTTASGSAVLGRKDDCAITYDQFVGIYWSERPIPSADMLPTEAYEQVSETKGPSVDFGNGMKARVRNIYVSAEKPCGKVIKETLKAIEMYCAQSRTHIAVVGMIDPVITEANIVRIAQSMQCP